MKMKNDFRGGQKPYNESEFAYMRANSDMPIGELTKAFNAEFGRHAEPKRISMYLRRMGIEPNIRAVHKYTEEEKDWLRKNVPELTVKEVARRFNERFCTSITPGALKRYGLQYLNVKRTNEATLRHRRELNAKVFTRFHVGDISVHIRGGRPTKVIMVMRDMVEKGCNKAYWVPYARYLWEKEYGPLPKGYRLIPLNNDGTDCRLENWCVVPADVMALMARNQWYSTNPDVTMTAIKLCELARVSNGEIKV